MLVKNIEKKLFVVPFEKSVNACKAVTCPFQPHYHFIFCSDDLPPFYVVSAGKF